MNNQNFQSQIENSACESIEKMFWIAGSYESDTFREYLEELEERDFREFFKEYNLPALEDFYKYVSEEEYPCEEEYIDNILEFFFDNNFNGLIAEFYVPQPNNPTYDENGELSSCGFTGARIIKKVYADSLDELAERILEVSEETFNNCLERIKEKENKSNKN